MASLTLEILKKRLRLRIREEQEFFSRKTVHLIERPLPAEAKFRVGPHTYRTEQEAFLVVIDEAPMAFWTHPVIYELYPVETGEIKVIHEKYPLEDNRLQAELVPFYIPDLPEFENLKKGFEPKLKYVNWAELLGNLDLELIPYQLGRPCTKHQHALFVAGMNNMPHFHNDFAIIRAILILQYGYNPDNITVVMGDGSGYADLPVDYAGTVADLEAALDTYAPGGIRELGPDDTLFLYTFNHGGMAGTHATLCMDGWASYYDYQLKAKLDNLNCGKLIVAMNQCHSGGFIPEITSTTGPAEVSIMTACRGDQSAWACSSGGAHGYFSVVLATALNWAFPSAVDPAFPGYTAGDITTHDNNGDGLTSVEEAWLYVQNMMSLHHYRTIWGDETPQYGESAAGLGATHFWGRPRLVVRDGFPDYWTSPDIYLHNPLVTPSDATADPSHPDNWKNFFEHHTFARIVARVHNTGCATCRNVHVRFYRPDFTGDTSPAYLGTDVIPEIEPDSHAYAWIDQMLDVGYTGVIAKADADADPAMSGFDVEADDNQAQRSLLGIFVFPYELVVKPRIIDRWIRVCNELETEAVLGLTLPKRRQLQGRIKVEIPNLQNYRRFRMNPGEEKKIQVRTTIYPQARQGDAFDFPIRVRRFRPGAATLGGITVRVEMAKGALMGRIIPPIQVKTGKPARQQILLRNLEHPYEEHTANLNNPWGYFNFPQLDPGHYVAKITHPAGFRKLFVSVHPNRTTHRAIRLLPTPKQVSGILRDKKDQPVADTTVAIPKMDSGTIHLFHSGDQGELDVTGLLPGDYEVHSVEQKGDKMKKIRLETHTLDE